MILSGHQPGYLPYIGFFNKVMHSDIFVLCDYLQYVKKEWQNRNRIREINANWAWLTVPVYHTSKMKINEIMIDNRKNWGEKHLRILHQNYEKAPFFKDYESFFEELYSRQWKTLCELNETIIRYLFKELKIETQIIKGSTLNPEGKKTDMLISMCKKTKADTYLSGIGGHEYIDEPKFKENRIFLFYQDYHCPQYSQCAEPFIPNMSVIDLIFNMGSEKSRKLIFDSGGMIQADR